MYRFSQVTYHSDTQTVDIGTGLIWDDVYAALEPYGVNVVGGRVSNIGVAGFSLGGGLSASSLVIYCVTQAPIQPNSQAIHGYRTSMGLPSTTL